MDYRQRPAPTTDAETYEFINELGDKKNNVVPIGPLHVTSDERATSVCSSMAKTLSTPTTVCSTSIAAWKNWRKPVWVITK